MLAPAATAASAACWALQSRVVFIARPPRPTAVLPNSLSNCLRTSRTKCGAFIPSVFSTSGLMCAKIG